MTLHWRLNSKWGDPMDITIPDDKSLSGYHLSSPSNTVLNTLDLNVPDGSMVGEEIMNLKDGSKGNILSNIGQQITVDALVGGKSNLWKVGDLWYVKRITYNPLVVNDGDVFEQCNFASSTATGMIFGAKKNLVFVNCNLANCVYHPTSRVKQCQVGNYDFCSHLVPDGLLPNEVENCRHVIRSQEVVNEATGETVTRYTRSALFLGRRTDENMTDEETKAVLAPYLEIRQNLQHKPKWV